MITSLRHLLRKKRSLIVPLLIAFAGVAGVGVANFYADGKTHKPDLTTRVHAGKCAERSVLLTVPPSARKIGLSVDYLEDREGGLTIRDVVSIVPDRFRPSHVAVPHFGITGSAYWIRLTLVNPERVPLSFDLVVAYPQLDDIILYKPVGHGGYTATISGDRMPFREREVPDVRFVFPLRQNPGAATYYLRVCSTTSLKIPISVLSREETYRDAVRNAGLNGLYYGVLIIMMAYHFFIFFSVKSREYLYYVFCIGGFIMASLAMDGYGARYVWPANPEFSVTAIHYFLGNVLYLVFTREFLGTRAHTPRLDNGILAAIALGTAGLVVNLFVPNSIVMVMASVACTAVTIFLVVTVLSVTMRQKVAQAGLFAASWFMFFVAVILYIAQALAVLPMDFSAMSLFKAALVVQMLIFSFGLADRINVMRNRLEVLNRNLEVEVVEHVRDKEALKRSEERFRGVVERNFDLIFTMDREGHFTYLSPSVVPLTGYRADELVGKSFWEYLEDEMKGLAMLTFGDLLKGREVIGYEATVSRKDGIRISLEVNVSPVMSRGDVIGFQGIGRDITERKLAEETLIEEKERLSITLRSIAEGVIATDTRFRVHLMNSAAEELTGWHQTRAKGRPLRDILVLVDRETGSRREFLESEITGSSVSSRSGSLLIRSDGSERIVSERAAPIRDRGGGVGGYVFVIRDITEEVKFRNELLKIEKLESIGILAGGIAHDFNNILTAIIGNITLARLVSPENGRLNEILADAELASQRARDLTQQFLTFSKGGAPVRQIASVEDIIRDSSRFVLRGSRVRCIYDFKEGLWPVNVDVGQFSQVIQNLVLNAEQAMPEGGEISITTENIVAEKDSGIPLKPGNYVRIMVSDSGVGIPAENIPKVFDPYFTTKAGGNGLGLTSTFSIIKRHDGYISVESFPGSGTSFSIYLPSTDSGDVEVKGVEESPAHLTGKVLFMDDDEAVNATAMKMLEHLGFKVEIAHDGGQAVGLYERSLDIGEPFDVVILDLTIPGGMGGKKTLERLMALDDGVRAVVSSGYSTDLVMANYRDYGFKGVIAKPYRIDELSRVLHLVMMEG
ncbi:MAG: PAS domain S-box protein [Spirochaetes bacterium]|nr:PAS domain S-box protein [Spirochaetota bacterium]